MMIDESIRTVLNEKHGDLNFKGLLAHMEASGIDFKASGLIGPIGLATFYCVYIDMEKINAYHDKMLFFVILHEMGHFKRITKVGKDTIIGMLSLENFEEFFAHVIGEEIAADRYACYCYNLLNREVFPRHHTQQLDKPSNQSKYRFNARMLFGKIQNNEENYKRLLESFLYEV